MTTLAAATLAVAKCVTNVIVSTSSSGTATTLADDNFPVASIPADDYYNGGTIWFLSGLRSTSSPTNVITDWTQSTKTFTFATGSSVTVGISYAVANADFPRYALRQAVNDAVQSMPFFPTEYENASYITVADQMSYNYPTGVTNVLQVWLASSTATPYDYVRNFHWAGYSSYIRFDEGTQPSVAGYRIRLIYSVAPGELDSDEDAVNDFYDIDWLKWEGAVSALEWRMNIIGDDEGLRRQYVKALAEADKQRKQGMNRLPHVPKDVHLPAWMSTNPGAGDLYISEINRVRL